MESADAAAFMRHMRAGTGGEGHLHLAHLGPHAEDSALISSYFAAKILTCCGEYEH